MGLSWIYMVSAAAGLSLLSGPLPFMPAGLHGTGEEVRVRAMTWRAAWVVCVCVCVVYLEWLRTKALLLFEKPNDDGLEAGEGM